MIRLGFSMDNLRVKWPGRPDVLIPRLRDWEADFKEGPAGLMAGPVQHTVMLPGGLKLRVTLEVEKLSTLLGSEASQDTWSVVVPLDEGSGLEILDAGGLAPSPQGKWSGELNLGVVKIGWRQ